MISAPPGGILQPIQRVVAWLAEHQVLLLNHALLFICASIYLGTGVSLVLFQLPSFAGLTVDNYYEYLVPPVDRATAFFTYMTMVMYVTATVMLIAELGNRLRWAPVVVLLAVSASTALTVLVIFDNNERLRAGISDQAELQTVVADWAALNWVRASLWVVIWLAVMTFFAIRAAEGIRTRR